MDPRQELEYRRELQTGVQPRRELELRRALSTKEIVPESFTERVGERFAERKEGMRKTATDYAEGRIPKQRAMIHSAGDIAGTAMDVLGEGLVSVGEGISYLIPDDIEEGAKEQIARGWDYITNTEYGEKALDAVSRGMDGWSEFKEENPTAAKDIESVANIGLLVAPVKTKANAKPSMLSEASARTFGKAAQKTGRAASRQIARKRGTFVQDLIKPKMTPKVKEKMVGRTTDKGKYVPTDYENKIAAEVSRVKGVTPKRSIQQNYNAVRKEIGKLGDRLERDVMKSRVNISHPEAINAIDDAMGVVIEENPIIVGNLTTTARRVADNAKKIIASHEPTPAGLLKARKEFDNWVRSLPRGEAKLSADSAMEAQSIAVKTARNTMNKLIDAKVNTTQVSRELGRQSLLYDALERIAPKAAEEANSALGRAWQNAVKVIPIRNKVIQEAAAVTGIGGLGAAAKFAPVFTTVAGTVGAGALAGKLAMSPKSKIMVGKMLKAIDTAIDKSTNPSMIQQLRADRALIVEILENAEITEQPPEE